VAPREPAAAQVLALQASAGNHAVANMLGRLTGPKDLADAAMNYGLAIEKHQNQSRILAQWVQEGLASDDPLVRNACEWVSSGKSRLFAITPTGDSDERVTHLQHDPKTMLTYFPEVQTGQEAGDISAPGGASYNPLDLDDQSGVTMKPAAEGGWNTPTGIPTGVAVVGVPDTVSMFSRWTNTVPNAVTKELVWRTLKHEVQHAADRSRDAVAALEAQSVPLGETIDMAQRLVGTLTTKTPMDHNDLDQLPVPLRTAMSNLHAAATADQPPPSQDFTTVDDWLDDGGQQLAALRTQTNFLKYQTEFRAYSYQGNYLQFDNQSPHPVRADYTVPGSAWTERQWKIFAKIHDGYEHTRDGWSADLPLPGTGQTFRQAVLAYRDPDTKGVNKLDSVRVDAFYDALMRVPVNTSDAAAASVAGLTVAARGLNAAEKAYVRNTQNLPRELTDLINQRVTGNALATTHAALM
jgi:hypothetical protein